MALLPTSEELLFGTDCLTVFKSKNKLERDAHYLKTKEEAFKKLLDHNKDTKSDIEGYSSAKRARTT